MLHRGPAQIRELGRSEILVPVFEKGQPNGMARCGIVYIDDLEAPIGEA
jgi:hypothetical protein